MRRRVRVGEPPREGRAVRSPSGRCRRMIGPVEGDRIIDREALEPTPRGGRRVFERAETPPCFDVDEGRPKPDG